MSRAWHLLNNLKTKMNIYIIYGFLEAWLGHVMIYINVNLSSATKEIVPMIYYSCIAVYDH